MKAEEWPDNVICKIISGTCGTNISGKIYPKCACTMLLGTLVNEHVLLRDFHGISS